MRKKLTDKQKKKHIYKKKKDRWTKRKENS